ncbi:MAG TPA: aminotransferase class IV [Chitinophagaceae bacterium]|nr:aminotransferase class IV [Chitinophagaceae bacterium]
MEFIVVNGNFIEKNKAALALDDHSYRYGDGLFETMKIANGNILLEEYHFKRLFSGLKTLKIKTPALFTRQKIDEQVKRLCKKNNYEESARVRLSVSRGSGGLYDCDNKFSYLIECWQLEQNDFNENGLVIDIFPDARKSIDIFSNLKSANYLPYVMAALWAKENKLNDALILNQHERICDATIANVFWVKDGKIFTPSLNEGCVAGVMRKKILELTIRNSGFLLLESVLTEDILFQADEVFLTNAITGIRWVKECRRKTYSNTISSKIFAELA